MSAAKLRGEADHQTDIESEDSPSPSRLRRAIHDHRADDGEHLHTDAGDVALCLCQVRTKFFDEFSTVEKLAEKIERRKRASRYVCVVCSIKRAIYLTKNVIVIKLL